MCAMKEVRALMMNIGSLSGGQARVKSWDSGKLTVEITPADGCYRGGTFDFELQIGEDFPMTTPVVSCLTPIHHPNIDSSTDYENVCLNILSSDWTSQMGLEDCVQGLLFLLHNPNLEDPIDSRFSDLSREEFFVNAQRFLLEGGGETDEGSFVGESDDVWDGGNVAAKSTSAVTEDTETTDTGERVCSLARISSTAGPRMPTRSFTVSFIRTNSAVPGCVCLPEWLLKKNRTYAGQSKIPDEFIPSKQNENTRLNLRHVTTM